MTGLAWDDGPVPVLRWESSAGGRRRCVHLGAEESSEGAFASLNLGALTATPRQRGREPPPRRHGYRRDPAQATMAWQIHGSDVREVIAEPAGGRFLEAGREPFPRSDGLVTSLAGRPLVLLTADCIPVAVARADGGRVAVLHAGWRGLEAGVLRAWRRGRRGRAAWSCRPRRRAVLLRGRRRRGRPVFQSPLRRRRRP